MVPISRAYPRPPPLKDALWPETGGGGGYTMSPSLTGPASHGCKGRGRCSTDWQAWMFSARHKDIKTGGAQSHPLNLRGRVSTTPSFAVFVEVPPTLLAGLHAGCITLLIQKLEKCEFECNFFVINSQKIGRWKCNARVSLNWLGCNQKRLECNRKLQEYNRKLQECNCKGTGDLPLRGPPGEGEEGGRARLCHRNTEIYSILALVRVLKKLEFRVVLSGPFPPDSIRIISSRPDDWPGTLSLEINEWHPKMKSN